MIKPILIRADVYSGLTFLKDNSVDFAITSPPYWGQRDYGFEGQIGNEDDPEGYIAKLLVIFRLLQHKLTDDGVFFLNIGDKYISKYGKTPIGMIPYRLAYQMRKDGWYLQDILIWYKPNHMPSSIKNRFVNSYEPIFVLTKSNDNIYSRKIEENPVHERILRVNLQPTKYKHMAAYPEKLVEDLLHRAELKKPLTILDPFAGSGTTLKAAQNIGIDCKCYLIDNNEEYLNLIIERCNLQQNYKVISKRYIPYYVPKLSSNEQLTAFEDVSLINNINITDKGFVYIAKDCRVFRYLLDMFFNKRIKGYIRLDSVCFLGTEDFDIELIYNTSLLMKHKWIIRNMIVVEKDDGKWFPVFMIVDDNKRYNYHFDYKRLALKSKNGHNRKWKGTNFIGYKVSGNLDKRKVTGVVVEVLKCCEDYFPEYVIVKWDNGGFTKEYVKRSQERIDQNITIDKENFKVKEIEQLIGNEKEIECSIDNYSNIGKVASKNYNGKFKNEKRVNWGASPGARQSVDEEFFSLQRLYSVDQAFVSDYLNKKRIEKSMSKKDLTNLFPPKYKHTVGHWLRNDFGGSIPNLEDWRTLEKILDFEDAVSNYVCKTALKLQTVNHGEYKAPDDFLSIDDIDLLKILIE